MPIYSKGRIVRESLPVLLSVLVFSLLTGSRLEVVGRDIFLRVPSLFIVLPAFMNMAGDLADVFCSKITSLLHTGQLSMNFRPLTLWVTNIFAVLSVSFIGFSFISGVTVAFTFFASTSFNFLRLFFSILFSGVLSTFLMIAVGLVISYLVFSMGIDPDNFTPPVTTTVGDLISTSILLYSLSLTLAY